MHGRVGVAFRSLWLSWLRRHHVTVLVELCVRLHRCRFLLLTITATVTACAMLSLCVGAHAVVDVLPEEDTQSRCFHGAPLQVEH